MMNCDGCSVWIPACAGMTVVGIPLREGNHKGCPYVHPPSPLTLREGGRFLVALGMTRVCAVMTGGSYITLATFTVIRKRSDPYVIIISVQPQPHSPSR